MWFSLLYTTWGLQSFLNLWADVFYRFGKFLAIISSNLASAPISFSFLSESPITFMPVFLAVSHMSSCSVLSIVFFSSGLQLDIFSWAVFKSTNLVFTVNKRLLNPCYELFISDAVFFSSSSVLFFLNRFQFSWNLPLFTYFLGFPLFS